jgi:ATP-dependent helicase Lhr and Lhr-like helicase
VSAFEQLHPALQHHIVNSLGWRSLRPHQEQAILPVLTGEHVLIQAPTAGGKTEAAVLPLLSRMLTEEWHAPAILYLCPIKALINDLETRLTRLASMVGRRVAVWHGDVSTAARRRIDREPPDILLATPESIEVMLVSRLLNHYRFFASVRAVVVDEVHAFAGDDRGWHLLSLLERVSRLADAPVQRIALSATLSNAGELVDWLVAGADVPRRVVAGEASAPADVDVQVDYVGSLGNAATVISRMHSGEKRLVFCDSRTQVERLATDLRGSGVRTYVSHSSLSRDERKRAEEAFSQESDCVIVSTSTLELGIDVGDLDRVIQIDAPRTVASFLQRIGRSGRRPGTRRNCLFLTTRHDSLLRALGLVQLWSEGYVEPVIPPFTPYHVAAQQLLALVLQEGGIASSDIGRWIGRFSREAGIPDAMLEELRAYMLDSGFLFEDGGLLSIGPEGEAAYGAKNFLEVFSVFNSPPLFTVFEGRNEIGQVHELTFLQQTERPMHLSLGGRGWKVTHIEWDTRRAFVEASEQTGRSRWLGSGQSMHFELAQAIKRVLLTGGNGGYRSRRADAEFTEIREEFYWLDNPAATLLVQGAEESRWWSFGGDRVNSAVAGRLGRAGVPATHDSLAVTLATNDGAVPDLLQAACYDVQQGPAGPVPDDALENVKFGDCVPAKRLEEMVRARTSPGPETADLIRSIGIKVLPASS